MGKSYRRADFANKRMLATIAQNKYPVKNSNLTYSIKCLHSLQLLDLGFSGSFSISINFCTGVFVSSGFPSIPLMTLFILPRFTVRSTISTAPLRFWFTFVLEEIKQKSTLQLGKIQHQKWNPVQMYFYIECPSRLSILSERNYSFKGRLK